MVFYPYPPPGGSNDGVGPMKLKGHCYPTASTPSPRPLCANDADQILVAIQPLHRPTSPGIPFILGDQGNNAYYSALPLWIPHLSRARRLPRLPGERGEGSGNKKHRGFSSIVPTSPPHVRTCLCLPCRSIDALAGVGLFAVPSRRSGPKCRLRRGGSRMLQRPAHREDFDNATRRNRHVLVLGERGFEPRPSSARQPRSGSHLGDRPSSTEPNRNHDLYHREGPRFLDSWETHRPRGTIIDSRLHFDHSQIPLLVTLVRPTYSGANPSPFHPLVVVGNKGMTQVLAESLQLVIDYVRIQHPGKRHESRRKQ